MRSVLSFLATLWVAVVCMAQQAPATPILSQGITIPIGGVTAPTCTINERNTRTGPCSNLDNPFDATTYVFVTDPSAAGSCVTAGVVGNPDVLCGYDDINDLWVNVTIQGSGSHTHPLDGATGIDHISRQSSGQLALWNDEDNDAVWDANELPLDDTEWDAVVDIGDTVRYPAAVDALRAIHAALFPALCTDTSPANGVCDTGGQTVDGSRFVKIVGQRTILHTDCELYATNTERVCLMLAPMASLDGQGDPVPDCTRDMFVNRLHIHWGNAMFDYRADGGDGVIDGDEQTTLTTGIAHGMGSVCGFESSVSTAWDTFGDLHGWLSMSGMLQIDQNGVGVDAGWTQNRIPVPYYAGKSSSTTFVGLRSWHSGMWAPTLIGKMNLGADKDNIDIWDMSGFRVNFGRWELSGGGTCLLTQGQGGPSTFVEGTHIACGSPGYGNNVAFGNEAGMHTYLNQSCIREAAPISQAGTCDNARPVGGNSGHVANLSGAIIENSAGFNFVSVQGFGNQTNLYFEGCADDEQADPNDPCKLDDQLGGDAIFGGTVIIGAGFRSDNGVPCALDPNGAPTCDAPEDSFEGGTTIAEDHASGQVSFSALQSLIGIGPGADNGLASKFAGQPDPEYDAQQWVDLVLNVPTGGGAQSEFFCTGAGTPTGAGACCTSPDMGATCPVGFNAHTLANISVDLRGVGPRPYDPWLPPASYAGRIDTNKKDRLAIGNSGPHTYSSDINGQTLTGGNTWTSTGGASMTISRSTGVSPDQIDFLVDTTKLGGNGDGSRTQWGSEVYDPNSSGDGCFLGWRFATTGTDPDLTWCDVPGGLPDNWMKWSTLAGWDWGNAILSFTSNTSETCDAGEQWIGRVSGVAGFCNNGSFNNFGTGGGGSNIAVDFDDNGSSESTALNRIATGGSDWGSSAVMEIATNELKFYPGRPWPGGGKCIDADNNASCDFAVFTSANGACTANDVPCVCNTNNTGASPSALGCVNKWGEFIGPNLGDNSPVAGEPGNIFKMLGNTVDLTTDPTCANKFGTDTYGFTDPEAANTEPEFCYENVTHIKWVRGGAGNAYMQVGSSGGTLDAADGVGDLRVRDALEVDGPLVASKTVVVATSSPTALAAWQVTDDLVTNDGAGGSVEVDLPDAVAGMCVTFYVDVAQTLLIDPFGTEQILVLTNGTGDRISNATIGSSIELCAITSTEWIALGREGTWSDAN